MAAAVALTRVAFLKHIIHYAAEYIVELSTFAEICSSWLDCIENYSDDAVSTARKSHNNLLVCFNAPRIARLCGKSYQSGIWKPVLGKRYYISSYLVRLNTIQAMNACNSLSLIREQDEVIIKIMQDDNKLLKTIAAPHFNQSQMDLAVKTVLGKMSATASSKLELLHKANSQLFRITDDCIDLLSQHKGDILSTIQGLGYDVKR